MSILDLQAFMRDLLSRFDEKIDTSSGSEADKVIIQPLLRREGPDPFSMDVRAFLFDRLNQEFPSFATRDGDAISDLLVKPLELLMDPVVRENQRVRANLSFRDPATMTLDEAEALGGNFFVTRDKGDFAKGAVRIYFSSPQSATLTPANFVTSRGGLTYFPDGVQSIKVDEMLFNQEGDLYYFDINIIAEQAGDQYNIEANEIVQIANFTASVKITNKRRIRGGIAAETVIDFVARIQQEITERSLVTKRGIVAVLSNNFPEMTRINVAGFNDPEMQRDIIEGGSLGSVRAGGLYGFSIQDGEAHPNSRRFRVNTVLDGPVDFTTLIGPPTSSGKNFILVVHGTFLGTPYVRDVEVRTVVDAITLDLEEQVFPLTLLIPGTAIVWELRKRELTLSKIPGGILFPDSPNGTVSVPSGQIHIGGATDSYLRGTVLDSGSLIIDGLSDDSPVLAGSKLESDGLGQLILHDFVIAPFPGANYTNGDATFEAILEAPGRLYVIQVLDGIAPGTYTLQNSIQPSTAQGNPAFTVFPPNPVAFTGARWRLVDIIDIDLNEPKETRVSGSDLSTLQASATVTTLGGLNFNDFGVAVNDTLRILSGKDAGDYTVKQVTPFPFFTQIVLDRTVTSTASGLQYIIFRPNAAGATSLPFIRMKSIDLLDSNKQPVGSTVPYAKPIGASSFSFSNPARGVKLDLVDAHLGIVGLSIPAGANVNGLSLQMTLRPGGVLTPLAVTFTGLNPVPLSIAPGGPYPQGGIIEQINTTSIGLGVGPIAVAVGSSRLGIIPVGFTDFAAPGGPTAISVLFGDVLGVPVYMNSKMVRSTFLDQHDLVQEIQPPLDLAYDVVQVVDGLQVGAHIIQYAAPYPGAPIPPGTPPVGLALPHVLVIGDQYDFSPEPDTHVLLGARSLGKARLYFLEPTSFEVGLDTLFHATLANGTVLDFQPDPAMEAQLIPALPSGPKPVDGAGVAGGNVLTSPTTNFIKRQIRVGDIVVIDYIPIIGSIALADPVLNLAFTTLIIEFADGTQKTITFVHDNGAIPATAVTRAGVANQINNAVGKVICKINATNRLEFDAQVLIIIHPTGTANPLLGFSVLVEQTNRSPYEGRYTILALGANQVTLTPSFPLAPPAPPAQSNMQFSVFRRGTQRTGTTTMSTQAGPAGLYYTDVELVSVGTGDAYNLDAGIDMTLENYRSDGYYLTNEDTNLTFSMAEKIHLHVSRTINEVGTDDNPENSTNLLGQNIQTNYEFSALVANVQSFLQADLERVVCASPLARHLVPHFIRFDLQYSGGPKEADVLPDIQTLIQALFPDQQLEVSDITAILTSRGTNSIVNPITLYGVIYNTDRSVSLERSQDRINVGRMAAFIPDVINLTRNLT